MTVLETDQGTTDQSVSPEIPVVDFDTAPDRYRHWMLEVDGDVATVTLRVDEDGGLVQGYALKMNSYDLGVDIELYDAVQRLRFEHPEVRAVVMTGGLEKMFCAGANIRMLAQSSHAWKVNFCKFTNETRNTIEDAHESCGETWIAALNGACAGGGYELALACDEIVLTDDGSSTVSLPEVPLLGVLPGTGGLTRVVEWGLVDAVIPRSKFADGVAKRARELAAKAPAIDRGPGLELDALSPRLEPGPKGLRVDYRHVTLAIDDKTRIAELTVRAPTGPVPAALAAKRFNPVLRAHYDRLIAA